MSCVVRSFFATLAVLLTFPSLINSWTYSAYVNLAWPPIENEGFITLDGTWTAGHGQNDPTFPCGQVPVDANQKRTPFPTEGGFLHFDLVNNTGALSGYNYDISPYFGQISTDSTTDQIDVSEINTYVYENFRSEGCATPDISNSINATLLISEALLGTQGQYDTPTLDIVGMNATVGLRMVLFSGDNNVEEMYQCAYVTFVSPADFAASGVGGVCADTTTSNLPTASATIATTPTPTSGYFPFAPHIPTHGPGPVIGPVHSTPASTGFFGSSPQSASSHTSHTVRNVAIGVGVVVAAAVTSFVLIGLLLLRRRRRSSSTVSPDLPLVSGLWHSTNEHQDKEAKLVEKSGKVEMAVERAESVSSDAPPTYTEAVKGDSNAVGNI